MGGVVRLRLLADDLTGALDSAARFVPLTGRLPVLWHAADAPESAAFDSGTRDLMGDAARARIEEFATVLAGADIAFKKIDSLLRGHVSLELAACRRFFDHCVLAPAFPFQGRITRGGRQLFRTGDTWRDTDVTVPGMLDAETAVGLDAIVADGHALSGRVLWCGTGGLAGALANHLPVPKPRLPSPILALIGSDHPVSRAHVAAVQDHRRMSVMTCDLPAGTSRAAARQQIRATFAARLREGDRPGTLFVTGGETLRDLCTDLGASHLEVDGELEPGVPTSLLCGGPWDGQRIVSKSGAFGDAEFLARLLL
jgi:D-threonate/D-erythronate kinase